MAAEIKAFITEMTDAGDHLWKRAFDQDSFARSTPSDKRYMYTFRS